MFRSNIFAASNIHLTSFYLASVSREVTQGEDVAEIHTFTPRTNQAHDSLLFGPRAALLEHFVSVVM